MGALPKNKITRAERGKRRRGNTPKLVKDTHRAVPLHKQGFVAQLFRFVGITSAAKSVAPVTKTAAPAKKAAKPSKAVASKHVTPVKSTAKPVRTAPTKTVKASSGTSSRRSGSK